MTLLDLLESGRRPVFLDGAMGTQLGAVGVQMGGPANLSDPEAVQTIHERYAACGIDLIITNTLTMNRVNIESHGVGVDTHEVNQAGVRLAKAAARPGQFVLGDISSTGKLLKPYGPLEEDDASATYLEQAGILAEAGVDGFIIETMIDLREALCALKAAREAAALPVIVSISFNTAKNSGRTIMGDTAAGCATALAEAGADVVGANCGGVDPDEMAEIIALMREAVEVPLIAQPNAGKGRLVDGDLVFDLPTDQFTAGIAKCLEAGATLVGGCCGTSPAHIKAMVETLGRDQPHTLSY